MVNNFITHDIEDAASATTCGYIEAYQQYIRDNNFYKAKKLYKSETLSKNIITASLINELTQYIMDTEKKVFHVGSDWINYDLDISTYALSGDCCLR